jgi:hypothetical protein
MDERMAQVPARHHVYAFRRWYYYANPETAQAAKNRRELSAQKNEHKNMKKRHIRDA